MSGLLALLQRYAYFFIFVILEIISFLLIINYNQKQRDIFLHSSRLWSGSFLKRSAQISDYLNLKKSNDDLLAENARLLQELLNRPTTQAFELKDSNLLRFELIPCQLINNSILSTRNRILLDKGRKDGVRQSAGVIAEKGVIGIVFNASENYSSVLSVLNMDLRISASLEGQNFFGTVRWRGHRYDRLQLDGIPKHASVRENMLVMTNGYSTVFPKGIPIGRVVEYKLDNDGLFYEIDIKPTLDYSNLRYAYVINDLFAAEKQALENE